VRRPLGLVGAELGGEPVSLVLQNAEAIRLTDPAGEVLSVATLKPGDRVLGLRTTGGRRFGMAIEETITERQGGEGRAGRMERAPPGYS
jgi:3-dehydroquinate synthase II